MAWARTSRQSRGYGAEWDRVRLQVLDRDHHLCQCSECTKHGRVTIATQVDHIVPKAKGGTDELSNLQAINVKCHQRKTTADQHGRVKPKIGLDGWPITG